MDLELSGPNYIKFGGGKCESSPLRWAWWWLVFATPKLDIVWSTQLQVLRAHLRPSKRRRNMTFVLNNQLLSHYSARLCWNWIRWCIKGPRDYSHKTTIAGLTASSGNAAFYCHLFWFLSALEHTNGQICRIEFIFKVPIILHAMHGRHFSLDEFAVTAASDSASVPWDVASCEYWSTVRRCVSAA